MTFTATSPSFYKSFLRKPTYGLLPVPLTVQTRRSVSKISSPFPRLQACEGIATNGKILARDDRKLLPVFDFDQYIRVQTAKVNKALDEAVPLQDPVRIHEAMRYSLLAGGKRVRPILCLAACELVGGEDAQAMPVACATEMVHCMSLIHDDLPSLDNDPLRRGQPACHRAFDEPTAVLAGDALLCLAFVHVATKTVNVSPDRVNRAITELGMASGSKGVAAGQAIDMANTGKDVSLDTLEHIHIHKTSKLLEAAVVCGALVGGADAGSQQRLRAYARRLGLLFQVVDDILDATRSSEELGKTAGKDLESDKATYPKILGLEGARNFAAELLEQANHELASFDPVKAAPLFHIAKFVASRKN